MFPLPRIEIQKKKKYKHGEELYTNCQSFGSSAFFGGIFVFGKDCAANYARAANQ